LSPFTCSCLIQNHRCSATKQGHPKTIVARQPKKRNALHSEGWRTDPDGLSAHFQCWSLPSESRDPLLTSHSSLEAAPTCWRAVRHPLNGWKARGRGQCLATMHGRRGRRDVSSLYPFGLPGSLCRFVPLCVCDHVGAQNLWCWALLGDARLSWRRFRGRAFRVPIQSVAAPLCVGPRNARPRESSRDGTRARLYNHTSRSYRIQDSA